MIRRVRITEPSVVVLTLKPEAVTKPGSESVSLRLRLPDSGLVEPLRRASQFQHQCQVDLSEAVNGWIRRTNRTLDDLLGLCTPFHAALIKNALSLSPRPLRELCSEFSKPANPYREVNLATRLSRASHSDIEDVPASRGLRAARRTWRHVVAAGRADEFSAKLTTSETQVMTLRVLAPRDHLTLQQLAEQLDLTRERIRQVETKLTFKMRELLKVPTIPAADVTPVADPGIALTKRGSVRTNKDHRSRLRELVAGLSDILEGLDLSPAELRILHWVQEKESERLSRIKMPGGVLPYTPMYSLIRKLEAVIARNFGESEATQNPECSVEAASAPL